ncbi:IclR family transcriptional regulator [Paenibacillus sp. 2TAB23]|uniref:IclR family transcriptional regulator n=1 Tax=Paenibacillus sp. 2TAB23 TaxID=3233004 RepID=UPI003F952722
MIEKPDQQPYLLSSVANALRIMNSFTVEKPTKGVSELADELGISKSAVSRLLSTLASEGYVLKEPTTQKYSLGLQILKLNSVVTSQLEINHAAQPIIRELAKSTGEAVLISVLEDEIVYIEQIECRHQECILPLVGYRSPAHCTSAGKLLLAYYEKERLHKLVKKGFTSYTAKTITDKEVLQKQLMEIRKLHFSCCESEYLEGLICFSAPIRNYMNSVVAAITIMGPVQRINEHTRQSIINKLIRSAREISRELGQNG